MPEIDLDQYRGCYQTNWKDTDYTNGFIDQWGWCIPGFGTNATWFLKQPDLIYGKAVFYSPGIMHTTAKYRGLEYPDGYAGGVALGSPAEIGETVWINGPLGWEGPFLVVDCPQHVDVFTTIVIRQQAVEVDFETALRWGMVAWRNPYDPSKGYDVKQWSLGPVTVYKGLTLPDWIDTLEPVYFAQWWFDKITWADKPEPKPIWKPGEDNTILWQLTPGDPDSYTCLTCD